MAEVWRRMNADDTDFKTAKTALTIANTDIKLVINGAASANKNSGGGTHRINGVYGVTFDATDTATVGEIEVSVVVAAALPVFDKFTVVEEAAYDALFAASAPGPATPTNITAGTITTVTNLTNAPTAGDLTATMKTSVTTAATAATPIAASVTGAVGSVTGNVGGNVVGSVATLTQLTGANTELTAVPASTASLLDMIKWVFLLSRNKLTQTSTTTLVKANDGTTTVGTSTVSDDATTATRGVFS